ncbi:MAG: M20/M25/M40 family metallo-hydrolase [Chitinispirillales bacterium]|nr:M20/M25/M40 family metallo-hydrolase [Chitinispirillales bacterium]
MSKHQNKNKYMPPALCTLLLALFLSCIEHVEPTPNTPTAYQYFVDISAIPRCSGDELRASNYLAAFGRLLSLEVLQDEALNVLIKKSGTRGRENEPPVILQAHMDMVCRKDEGVEHDFDKDPIIPVITGDGWITAQKRTTLGADNGSGVSMILAVLAASGLSHPPIEALLTTEEEWGLLGADKFDVTLLTGLRLINLDMVTEKVFVIGSADDYANPDVLIPINIPTTALMKAADIPYWHYKIDSPLRDKMAEVFREYYGGEEPMLAGLQHAAVECSIFANKMPDADMVSIGPDMEGIHTPNEGMNLKSYNRVYGYLLTLLERL